MNKTKVAGAFIILILGIIFLSPFGKSAVPVQQIEKDAVVLAFGDSLTYGYGARAQAYPLQLERLIDRKVVNAGVSGEVSASGLKRLPELLEQYHPALVILCHGGNDILRRASKEKLRSNLRAMVRLSRESGAQVLLVGVPGFGLLGLSTVPLYEEVAKEENVLYEGVLLERIESDPALKSDQIHPNAVGYGVMAEGFATLLRESGML